jgi:hypothetical protein
MRKIEDAMAKVVHTLIFANVFQSEGQTGVFPLDDTNFAEGTAADNSEQAKVV